MLLTRCTLKLDPALESSKFSSPCIFFLAHKMYTYNDMTRSHQLKCYNIQSYTNSFTTFFHKGMHYKGTRWNNIRIMQQIMLNICFFSFLSLTLMHGTFLMHDKHSLCDTLEFVILSKNSHI
jgi:hypothetical protein